MNSNIYYKIAKWGNVQLYKYEDVTQVELYRDNPGRPGIVISDVIFSAGLHKISFNLELDFKENDAIFYTSDSDKKNKKYLVNGNNVITILVEKYCSLNLYFLIDNPSDGSNYKISNILIEKQIVKLENKLNYYLNSLQVFSLLYDQSNECVGTYLKNKYNLCDCYHFRNACLFVLPYDIKTIKNHRGKVYVYAEKSKYLEELKINKIHFIELKDEDILTEKKKSQNYTINKNEEVKKSNDFINGKLEELFNVANKLSRLANSNNKLNLSTNSNEKIFLKETIDSNSHKLQIDNDTKYLSTNLSNKKISDEPTNKLINESMNKNLIYNESPNNSQTYEELSNESEKVLFSGYVKLKEKISYDDNIQNIDSSSNALKIDIKKTDSTLYQVMIYDYKSSSNSISKCYIIENTNDGKSKISLIPCSEILPFLDINYVFVDTNRYMRQFALVMYNEAEPFTVKNTIVCDADPIKMRKECIDLKTKYFDTTKIFYENKEKKYDVLCILDEFSSDCFSHEVNLTHVTKDNINRINVNNYDFFLCESAWHGYNHDWTGYFVSIDRQQNLVLKTFIENLTIPKIFYNKEDPIHFEKFKLFASLFNKDNDLIITTDSGMVNNYKELGCKNIEYFPFCCQPLIHNPINRIDNNKIIFPCTWYATSFLERCDYMRDMIDTYSRTEKLDIFDRQYLFNKLTMQCDDPVLVKSRETYRFPKEYEHLIRGQLSYYQVLDSYKKYGIVMNANTITDSETMFSRRVIEAMACGCSVITNKSTGMKKILEKVYIEYNTKFGKKLLEDKVYRNKIQYIGHTIVMKNYTYDKLIKLIESNIFATQAWKISKLKKKSIVIVYLYKNEILNKKMFNMFSKYDILPQDIMKDYSYQKIECDYFFIVGDWFNYSDDYVENSIIPFSFANIEVSGKACYISSIIYSNLLNGEKNTIVGENEENKFTNQLHPFTTVFKYDCHSEILNGNVYNNVILLLRNIKPSLSYSYYKYDFVDSGQFCKSFFIDDITFLNNGSNVENKQNAIIMCNWKRTDRIRKILYNLSNQTNENFIFCIWNNNEEATNELLKYLKAIRVKFQIIMYDSKINIGGFGRFLLAKYVTEKFNVENIMFFDDDQDIPIEFVEDYSNNVTMSKALNFFGRKFIKDKPYCVTDEEFNLVKDKSNECVTSVLIGECYDYGGTGGMCVKSFIFTNNNLFDIPLKYLYCEDIWLSYLENTKYNIKIIKSGMNITTIKDSLDQCTGLWNTKNEFLYFLRNSCGWNV